MTDTFDEFSFLPAQASVLGIPGPLPRGERVSLTLEDGRTLSALRYAASGDAGGPAVTLLHGAGLNAHTWDTTTLALGLPTLAVDLPGHGDSSWRDDAAYAAGTLAPDVIAGLDAWTSGPQVLVGQSLGALVAAAVAAARPDLVRALIVIDITPGVDPSAGPSQIRAFFAGPTDWASRDELVDRALSFGLGGSRDAAERGVYLNSRVRADGRVEWKHHFAHLAAAAENAAETADANAAETAAADAVNDAAADSTAPAAGDAVAGVLTETGWDDLAAVTAPLTLIRGDHGYVTEADAAEFSRRLPDASVVVVPTGHNVQEEMPGELGGMIRGIADVTG